MKRIFLVLTLLLSLPVLVRAEDDCCDAFEAQTEGFPFVNQINNDGNLYPVELAKKPVFLSRVTGLSRYTATLGPLRFTDITSLGNIWQRNTSDECWLDINPTDPKNMIIVTHQDRSDQVGVFLGNIILYTKDGGKTWQEADVIMSKCQGPTNPRSNADYDSASDPNVVFDNCGTAYMNNISFNLLANFDEAVTVLKSTDGGASWSSIQNVTRDDGNSNFIDKQAIWNDPFRSKTLYALYSNFLALIDGSDNVVHVHRTTNAGTTWEPRVVAMVSGTDFFVFNAIIQVLDNKKKTLVLTGKSSVDFTINKSPAEFLVSLSEDGGDTWQQTTIFDDWEVTFPVDPDLNIEVLSLVDGADTAINRKNNFLYAVAQDGRFATDPNISGGSIITMSKDGGKTWIDPLPIDEEHLDAQAFLPTVAVAKDGTVGVLFYDFRNAQDGADSLDTDVWLALYNEDLTEKLDEIRITPVSFDTRQFMRRIAGGTNFLFPGDYTKLQADGNDFVGCFCVSNPPYGVGPSPENDPNEFVVDQRNRQDILFTRVKRKRSKRKNGKRIVHRHWKKVTQKSLEKRKKEKKAKISASREKLAKMSDIEKLSLSRR